MVIIGIRLQTWTRVIVNRCIGKIIAGDLSLVASQLYTMAVTRPQSRVAVTRSNHAARLLTATRLCLNSPPEAPKNWGQINPNLNDYHSDPMEVSSTVWIPDISDMS
jgi:hypothetical protein